MIIRIFEMSRRIVDSLKHEHGFSGSVIRSSHPVDIVYVRRELDLIFTLFLQPSSSLTYAFLLGDEELTTASLDVSFIPLPFLALDLHGRAIHGRSIWNFLRVSRVEI